MEKYSPESSRANRLVSAAPAATSPDDPDHENEPSGVHAIQVPAPAASPAADAPWYDPASVTLLRCAIGKRAAKLWTPDHAANGKSDPIECGLYFSVGGHPVRTTGDIHALLQHYAPDPAIFAIRGALRSGFNPADVLRRSKHRPGEAPAFEATPRSWLMTDHDGLTPPPGLDFARDPARAAQYVRATLPPEFQGASCVWHASGSAGFKAGIRLHLWWILDRPVSDVEARAWLPETDTAAYRTVQPLFTANPVLQEVVDPMAARLGVLPGDAVVRVPSIVLPVRCAAAGMPRQVNEHDRARIQAEINELRSDWFELGPDPDVKRRDLYNSRVFRIGQRAHWLENAEAVRSVMLRPIFVDWYASLPNKAGHISLEELLERVDAAFDDGLEQPEEPTTSEADEKAARKAVRDAEDLIKHDPTQLERAAQKVAAHVRAGVVSVEYATSKLAKAVGGASAAIYMERSQIKQAVESASAAAALAPPRPAWQLQLVPGTEGGIKYGPENLARVLEQHPDIALWYDSRFEQAQWAKCPWRNPAGAVVEADDFNMRRWIERELGWPKLPYEPLRALHAVAQERPYDPWLGYLDSLRWDEVPRLFDAAAVLLGAHAEHERATFGWWLMSAAARSLKPGCQVDHTIVLEGLQGEGKTTFLRELVTDRYFTRLAEQARDLNDVRVIGKIHGPVIIELAEFAALAKRDVESIKAFLDEKEDRWQPLYSRTQINSPRTCVFVASTNAKDYLSDPTGNRRFWPIKCTNIDLVALKSVRDQLWAEAVRRVRLEQAWWPTRDDAARLGLVAAQSARLAPNVWAERLSERLSDLRPAPGSGPVTYSMESGQVKLYREQFENDVLAWVTTTQAVDLVGGRSTDAKAVVTALRILGWTDHGTKDQRLPDGAKALRFVAPAGFAADVIEARLRAATPARSR